MDVDSSSNKEKDSRREEPTQLFRYATEQRLQCTVCQKVRYRTDEGDVCSVPVEVNEITSTEQGGSGDGKKEGAEEKKYSPVTMESCISSLMGEEELDYGCPSCGKAVKAVKLVYRFFSTSSFLPVLSPRPLWTRHLRPS
jgi:ubiquitin carboxyl-terminal hydrolase 5/13